MPATGDAADRGRVIDALIAVNASLSGKVTPQQLAGKVDTATYTSGLAGKVDAPTQTSGLLAFDAAAGAWAVAPSGGSGMSVSAEDAESIAFSASLPRSLKTARPSRSRSERGHYGYSRTARQARMGEGSTR